MFNEPPGFVLSVTVPRTCNDNALKMALRGTPIILSLRGAIFNLSLRGACDEAISWHYDNLFDHEIASLRSQ
jgi:hypothetical protein